jgi:hypothetical protein
MYVCFLVYLMHSQLDSLCNVYQNGGGGAMCDELERMWMGTVMTCFKVISQHSPRGTDRNLSQCTGCELEPGSPEYETVLTITP